MPKARKKVVRKAKTVAKAKAIRAFSIADVLVIIGLVFVGLNALLVFIFMNTILESLAVAGITMGSGALIALAVIWIFIGLLVFLTNSAIKRSLSRRQMWGLLILSILLGLFGRVESGILVFIASIIYLVKTRKKRR